jgi:hypothetical protein
MPTQNTTPSAHERLLRSERGEREREKQSQQLLRQHINEVEQAEHLDRDAKQREANARRYDADAEFRQRVADDRSAFRNMLAVLAIIPLLAIADQFLATPDVSEWLASKAMVYVPHSWIENTAEGFPLTPVWLRFATGTILVSAFLAITLLVKKTSDASTLLAARFQVEPGDSASYNRLTALIWLRRAMKPAYMVILAILLFHLYDYDRQRANIVAANAASLKILEDTDKPVVVGSDPGVSAKPDKAKEPNSSAEDPATGLAKASAVVFCALWILHGLLVLMPTDGFGRELEYAHFRRGKIETEARDIRRNESTLLRGITRRIRMAPDNERDELIQIALPVVSRINEIDGRVVIQVPKATDLPNRANGPEDGEAPMPSTVPKNPRGPDDDSPAAYAVVATAPNTAASESEENGTSTAAYDAIFPRPTPA